MNRRWRVILIPVLILAASLPPLVSRAAYSKNAFEKEMEELNRRARVILGALIAEDWGKLSNESSALAGQARSVHDLTPKTGTDRIGEFQAAADSLGARAARLAQAAKERNGAAAARFLGETVGACVSCHAVFRK